MKKFLVLFCIFFAFSAFGASKPEIFVSTGHSRQVSYSIINPSESILVTISENFGTGIGMKIWDAKTGKEIKTVNMGIYGPTSLYFTDDHQFAYITYKEAYIFNTFGEKVETIKFPKPGFYIDYIGRSREYAFSYSYGSVRIYSMKDGSEIVLPEYKALKDTNFSLEVSDLGYGFVGLFYKQSRNDTGGSYVIYDDNLEKVKSGRINGDFSPYMKWVSVSPDLQYAAYQDKASEEDNTIYIVSLTKGSTEAKIVPRPMVNKPQDYLSSGVLGGGEDLRFSFLPDNSLLMEYCYAHVGLKATDNELNIVSLMKNGIYGEKKFRFKNYMKLSSGRNIPFSIGKSLTIYAGYQNGSVRAIDFPTGQVIREYGVKPLNFFYATTVGDKMINIHEDNDFDAGTQTYRYNIWDIENLKLEKYNVSNTGHVKEVYKRLSYLQGNTKILVNPDEYYSAIPSMFFKPGYKNDESYGLSYRPPFMYFNSESRYLFTIGQHSVDLYDKKDNKLLRASFYAFADGEWVIMTPDGYYTASDGGEQYINVRINNTVYPLGNYRETFFRPDLVKLSIDGNPLSGTKNIAEAALPPSVQIINTPASTDRQSVDITLKITDNGGGIGSVRLFVNGTGVMTDSARSIKKQGSAAETIKTYTLKIPSGESVVKAAVFDSEDAVQSNFAEIRILSAYAQAKKPSLYVLAVGIDSYRNPKLNLKYAAADADLFAQSIKASSQALFAKTDVQVLNTPEKTSKDAVIKALESFKSMNPDDVFVFFVASHGTVDDGEYFLITSNVGALSTERLKSDALTQAQLKESIANIPSTKKLILIDTCSSGKLGEELSAAMMTRGMSEDTAIKILSRAVGSTIISASTSQQEALEGYKGHGLFTYVFAEGLKGKADSDKDGFVKTSELANYIEETVPDIAQKFFNRAQFPTVNSAGQSFPVGRN